MKKTLLTVALAALATTAFANTNFYSYQGQDSSANLYTAASLELKHVEHHYSKTISDVKQPKGKKVLNDSKVRVEFGGSLTDANKLTYSFYARADQKFGYVYYKSAGVKGPQVHFRHGFDLNKTYVQVASPMYGSLMFGNSGTAATNMGDDTHASPAFMFSAFGADDQYQNAFLYTLPSNLVEGFGMQVSYGKDKASHLNYSKQYAANVSYDLMGTTLGSTLAITKTYANYETTNTMTSFDLSAMNSSMMDGLSVGAEFAYNLDKDAMKTVGHFKTSAYSFGVKASYEVNQYFMPYAGVAYVHSKKVPTLDSAVKVSQVTTDLGGYLGFDSKLYTYGALKVTGYLEGSLSKTKVTDKTTGMVAQKSVDATAVEKTTHKTFALGVKFAY